MATPSCNHPLPRSPAPPQEPSSSSTILATVPQGGGPPPSRLDLLIQTLVGVGALDVEAFAAREDGGGHNSQDAVLQWLLQNADTNVDAIQTLTSRREFPQIHSRSATAGLCRAASRGLRHLAEFFVGCGADVNGFRATRGRGEADNDPVVAAVWRELGMAVPLILACVGGHLGVVELLVERSASLERNPLYFAAQNGRTDVIEYLVMKGADVNATTRRDLTPFFAACKNGHTDAAKVLLRLGANPTNLAYKDAAIAAATSGSLETLQFVFEHGSRLATLECGTTAADSEDVDEALSAAGDRLDVVRWLSNYGDHTKQCPRIQELACPLYDACYMGRESVVEFLLDEGWQTSDLDVLLHVAASMGHTEVVKMLLHRKFMHQSCRAAADHNCEWYSNCQSEGVGLIEAAKQGHAQTVQAFLDFGIDVDSGDEYERTALHRACELGRLDVVKVLLEAGADMYLLGMADMTAMETAEAAGHRDIIEVLDRRQALEYGYLESS
ncbi:ankyrin repeat-containing domain protein [Zopfochytrium polystomum]|nr:ankyrin repeat-containing domain protein [Zopfochytrium polystomum]